MCCQVSATSRSLVKRSPTVCVCVCVWLSATVTLNTCSEYVGEVRQRRNVSNILGDALKCDGMNIILVIGVMNEHARVKHPHSVEFNNRTGIKLPVLCVLYKECAFTPYMIRSFRPLLSSPLLLRRFQRSLVVGGLVCMLCFPEFVWRLNRTHSLFSHFRIGASNETWSCIF